MTMSKTANEIRVADQILIGYSIARALLASLNPFRKFTNGRVHEIAREAANIAFTVCEYRKLYLLDGSDYWEQAAKCGFVKVEKLSQAVKSSLNRRKK